MDRKRLLDWFPHFVVNLLQNRCHFLLISGIAHQSLITLQRRFDLSGTALDLLANFRSQFAARALLGRCKKGRCSTLPIELHIAFDCDQRHPECARYLRLSRIAIDDQLGTKEPESCQSALLMNKHRQMAIKVVHLSIPLLKGHLRIDVRDSRRKDRQLYLWHAAIVATFGQKSTLLPEQNRLISLPLPTYALEKEIRSCELILISLEFFVDPCARFRGRRIGR